MDLKKWSPWNWFRKEENEEAGARVPVRTGGGYEHPFLRMHQEIDRLFDETLRSFGLPTPAGVGGLPSLLRPSLDISEDAEQYRIAVEVPGVSEKDIQVNLDGDTLTIQGEKKQESSEKEGNYHRVERSYGSFRRVLSLPDDADPERVDARFRDGVLTLTVGRQARETGQARRIEIKRG